MSDTLVNNWQLISEENSHENTIVLFVNTLEDENNGSANGKLSLREAILIANKNSKNRYEIVLEAGKTYNLTIDGRGENVGRKGDLDIVKSNIIIRSNGENKATINAKGLDRVFHVQKASNLELENIKITGGDAAKSFGGGIFIEESNVNLKNSIVDENKAKNGGGIDIRGRNANSASLNIQNSDISNNKAIKSTNGGGGINAVQATVDINDSVISGNIVEKDANTTNVFGGGAYFSQFSRVNIKDTRITENKSHSGAGIATFYNTKINIDSSFIGSNVAKSNGGGASLIGSSSDSDKYDNIITNTVFEENQAAGVGGAGNFKGKTFIGGNSRVINNQASSGGGFAIGGNSRIEQVIFEDNRVERRLNFGEGGAITYGSGGEHELIEVKFNRNYGNEGGAIAVGKLATRNPNTRVNIVDSNFNKNSANLVGGHIANIYGSVNILNSTFENGNTDDGGAIYIDERGNTTISGSYLSANQVAGFGGGIFNNDGKLNINSSEFSKNVASEGGAIHNNGNATIKSSLFTLNQAIDALKNNRIFEGKGSVLFAAPSSQTNIGNSTLSNNKQTGDGAVYIDGSVPPFLPEAKVTMTNNTIVNNLGDFDGDGNGQGTGGVHIFPGDENLDREAGILYAYNNIIAQNLNGSNKPNNDIFGLITEAKNNLIGNGSGAEGIINGVEGNIVGTNENPIAPLIEPLANNGGSTRTHALLADSFAIDAGDNNFVSDINDQRGLGFDRIVYGKVDIGAYEVQEEGNLNLFSVTSADVLTSSHNFINEVIGISS